MFAKIIICNSQNYAGTLTTAPGNYGSMDKCDVCTV